MMLSDDARGLCLSLIATLVANFTALWLQLPLQLGSDVRKRPISRQS